jgi:hypothetical protein
VTNARDRQSTLATVPRGPRSSTTFARRSPKRSPRAPPSLPPPWRGRVGVGGDNRLPSSFVRKRMSRIDDATSALRPYPATRTPPVPRTHGGQTHRVLRTGGTPIPTVRHRGTPAGCPPPRPGARPGDTGRLFDRPVKEAFGGPWRRCGASVLGWRARCLSNSVHPPANAPMPGQGNVDSPAEARTDGGKRGPADVKTSPRPPSLSSTAPVIASSPSATTRDQSTNLLMECECVGPLWAAAPSQGRGELAEANGPRRPDPDSRGSRQADRFWWSGVRPASAGLSFF